MHKKRILIKSLWIFVMVLLSLSACELKNSVTEPMAPTLGLSTSTIEVSVLEPTHEPKVKESAEVLTVVPTEAPTEVPMIPTLTPAVNKTCGQSGSMTVLLIGSDGLGGIKPSGADAIRIIKLNFDDQTIKMITFPRDLLVQSASLNQENQVQQALGLTYYDAYQAASGTPVEKNVTGARVLAQLLLDNFAVRPDYYLTMQLEQIAAMIDTMGGVEMTLPEVVTTEHGITFAAGKQTLDGAHAMEYIRFLYPGGEAARTARQNAFIKAFLAKFVSVDILPRVPELLTQFKDALMTDLSVEQLVNMACLTVQVPEGGITFGAVSGSDLVTENVPDNEAVRAYLKELLDN